MMNRILHAAARAAMALWTGAVAAVGLLVAPRVFRFLDDPKRAGDLMAPLFARVDHFGIAAALLFVAAARRSPWRLLLAALMGAAAAINAFALSPKIAARAENFELFHRVAEGLWTGILAAGLVLVVAGTGPRKPG